MKKWHSVLWVVLVALAIGSAYGLFMGGGYESKIASVNGDKITYSQFRRALNDLNTRIDSLRSYARMYGVSESMFITSILGGNKPEQVALDACVKEKLIDTIKDSFAIHLDSDWFKEMLVKSFPQGITDAQGNVNMDVYQGYVKRLASTPAEFEKAKEEELKRKLVTEFLRCAEYSSNHHSKSDFLENSASKSFALLTFPLDKFLKEVEQEKIDEKELELFYQKNKEAYRVPEKRKLIYWKIDAQEYAEKIEIDNHMIQQFYDKNKTALFRVPPKVTVRRLVLHADQKNRPAIFKKAQELKKEFTNKPEGFVEAVKIHSQEASSKNGGLITIAERGRLDVEVEAAAFKLKNPGDLSSVIKTQKGYEILQLVERFKAEEKPLDAVRDEVIKVLKTRRAVHMLKGDLEILMHSLKSNTDALTDFVKNNNLKPQETDFLSEKDTTGESFEAALAKKVFSNRSAEYGFILHENKYIVYRVKSVEKTFIPTLDAVQEDVESSFYESKAKDAQRLAVKNAKESILNKKATIEDVAKAQGVKLVITESMKKDKRGGKLKGFEGIAGLRSKLFGLTDAAQVLTVKHKDEIVLGQLQEAQIEETSFEAGKKKIIKKEKIKKADLVINAFIASLYRNAKIEVDSKILGDYASDTKD